MRLSFTLLLLLPLILSSCSAPEEDSNTSATRDYASEYSDPPPVYRVIEPIDRVLARIDSLTPFFETTTEWFEVETFCHKNWEGDYCRNENALTCAVSSSGYLSLVSNTKHTGDDVVHDSLIFRIDSLQWTTGIGSGFPHTQKTNIAQCTFFGGERAFAFAEAIANTTKKIEILVIDEGVLYKKYELSQRDKDAIQAAVLLAKTYKAIQNDY